MKAGKNQEKLFRNEGTQKTEIRKTTSAIGRKGTKKKVREGGKGVAEN